MLLALLVLGAQPAAASDTTVILVRHAEKDRADAAATDPGLTEGGRARARHLAHVLAQAGVAAIYSTPFHRTRDTAEPLAQALGLTVRDADAAAEHATRTAATLRAEHRGQTVVVVGHSNTTPDLARALGVADVPAIADDVFDQLWIVTMPDDGPSRLLRLRYGWPTP